MSPRFINGILTVISVLLWLTLMAIHASAALSIAGETGQPDAGIEYRIVLMAFVGVNMILLGRIYGNIDSLNVSTLLWRLFMIGMVGIVLILIITLSNRVTTGWFLRELMASIYFSITLYAMLMFFLSAFFLFRRFILYPRTRRKLIIWGMLMGFLGLALAYNMVAPPTLVIASYVPFVILSLILSSYVRWISHLNFNQKLRALGLFMLIILIMVAYFIAARRLPEQLGIDTLRLGRFEVLGYIMVFSLSYSIFSVLALFFNLPTSSIFERESFEIASYARINQAIQSNLDFTDILNTLLDAGLMTSNCKSGWIEMVTPGGEPEIRIRKRISPGDIREIKQEHPLTQKTLSDRKAFLIKNTRAHRAFRANTSRYRSLLCVPIFSNNHAYGAVYVVSELVNVFEEVTVRSLSTYAEQAGIALENAHLIKNSIELERYQEQLKIAKEVQNQLLPRHLPVDEKIEIVALSENAQEVGGDYYDVATLKPGRYQVAIGDVSGKGTTAAFHMAELKGVFHALSLQDLDIRAWIGYANRALSACMQKGFFVTLTYLVIDTETRRAELVRAGHCPAFWYRAGEDMLEQLREGAPGLGIVRNASYDKLVPPPEVLTFAPGDCLILYTDGILEARNEAKEEFGYARMHEIIYRHRKDSPREIATAIVHSAKAFARSALQDDYTVLVIRFG